MSITSLAVASGILAFGIVNVASPLLKVTHQGETYIHFRCAPRDLIVTNLYNQYKEKSIAHSIDSETGYLVEMYSTKDKKTWTFVFTIPGTKMACIPFSGEDWQIQTTIFEDGNKL